MYNNCETRASYLATVSPVVVSIAVVYPPERLNMLMSLPASHSATCTRAEIDYALLLDPTDLLPITLCFGLSSCAHAEIIPPFYLFFTDGRGLHSSPLTGCSMTLFGY